MSTPYDYITINTPTGGTSTTYTGTQISVNTPAVSDVTKAEVSFTSSQSLNGYSYPWADGTGTNQITGSNRMRDWEITGSGDVVNFYPYQKSSLQYLSRLTTTIVPQQSGSGDPSPSNVRPITGFDSANIYVSPTTSVGDATTYNVSFGSAGTVYGGTLDVVSGQLTVTHNYVDLGTLNWAYDSTATYPYFRTDGVSSTIKKVAAHTEYPNCICSNYMRATENQGYIGEVTGCISETTWGQIRIRDNRYTDAQAFKTAMNGVQLVYELATPLTYQLTATQVAMITGNNYIWTNCGTITDAGYKLTSSNNDTLTYLYAPNAGLCTGKMPTTIGLGYTYNYLSFEYYSTQAVDIDVYICGTDAKWYDTTYNRTKYVKWDTFSLPAKTSYTKYTLPTRSISLSDLTEGSGDVNSVYFEIVPTTNSPTYPMRIQHVQLDHNSASTTYVPSQNRCTYSGASSVTLYKRSTQSSSYENSYYKYLNTTVYNGSFEYITGKVTKTYVSITLNSSDLTWAVYNDSSTSRAFRATITNMKSLSHSSYDSTKCFCTHASWTTSSERLGFGKFYYSYGYVYFPDYNSKRFNSVDEFTAWLDLQESRGTPVTILYPLSTPTETTVSTTTIKTLAGQNYFDTSSTAANRLPLTMTILQTSFILPRPLNFAVQREDIYAGQYTTCTGATRADKIGWKYSDMTWSWDGLKQSDVEKLCSLSGECTLTFDDPSGDTIQESFIRSSVVSMRCRNKFEDEYWWTGVSCSISFIGSHTD